MFQKIRGTDVVIASEKRVEGKRDYEQFREREIREQQDQHTEIERRTVVASFKRFACEKHDSSFFLFVDRSREK